MPSIKAIALSSFVIIVMSTISFKLFKTPRLTNVPPKLHYQNKKLQFLPNKVNTNNTTYTSLTTRRPIPISTNITCSTSLANSRITILNGGEPHTVGDTLYVKVEMYDFANRGKLYGGDLLLARIFNQRLGAASSGVVTDLDNGVYNVNFLLFWPGESTLAFTLVHSSEAMSVLDTVREAIPDKVTFLGTFVNGISREVTSCHTFLNTTKEVCDFTDPHLREPWMCEKPSTLPCSALVTIKSYNKYNKIFNEEQSKFFTSDRIWVSKQPAYKLQVTPANGSLESTLEDCAMGFGNPNPSGYYLENAWHSTYCKMKQFNSPSSILNCLKGKNVILLGDSTIRQWWEYVVNYVKDLLVIVIQKPGKHQPKIAVNESYGIMWQWFCHSYPFIASADTYPEDLKYVANRIDNITGGANTILGISLGAHYTPFPLHVFKKRMYNIKVAVGKLLIRSPETKIIVKLANVRENYGVDILNNCGTFRINQILLEVFESMNVAFVDAWDMTAVLNSAQIHPNHNIVKNQVNAFLSFIC